MIRLLVQDGATTSLSTIYKVHQLQVKRIKAIISNVIYLLHFPLKTSLSQSGHAPVRDFLQMGWHMELLEVHHFLSQLPSVDLGLN